MRRKEFPPVHQGPHPRPQPRPPRHPTPPAALPRSPSATSLFQTVHIALSYTLPPKSPPQEESPSPRRISRKDRRHERAQLANADVAGTAAAAAPSAKRRGNRKKKTEQKKKEGRARKKPTRERSEVMPECREDGKTREAEKRPASRGSRGGARSGEALSLDGVPQLVFARGNKLFPLSSSLWREEQASRPS